MVSDLTSDILAALVAALPERKREALRVLRGDAVLAPTAEPFLTLRECGQRLGVTTCSLWRWKVPGHVFGGRRRFRMSEVEAYLGSEAFRQRAAELRILDLERRRRRQNKMQS